MNSELARTPLYEWHAAHGAKLVDFAGWSMPVQYESIVTEHVATRTAVGLFDVSHMGRFKLVGAGALPFLEGLLTRRVADLKPGQVRYSLVTNDQGGILDDVLVSRIAEASVPTYGLVVNAGNRQKIWDWICARTGSYDLALTDETDQTVMVAAQGPRAVAIADGLWRAAGIVPSQLGYYRCLQTRLRGKECFVSRSGYTGEDGIEWIVPADLGVSLWEEWIEAISACGGRAAGLGARDTLRLEAAMPLYGHELNETLDPFTAGLGFAVQLKERNFPGRDALNRLQDAPPRRRRVGLRMEGKRVPRENYAILHQGQVIGAISSGTFSPTLQHPIAMGYVEDPFAALGTEVTIDLRGRELPAHVTRLPFYQRTSE